MRRLGSGPAGLLFGGSGTAAGPVWAQRAPGAGPAVQGACPVEPAPKPPAAAPRLRRRGLRAHGGMDRRRHRADDPRREHRNRLLEGIPRAGGGRRAESPGAGNGDCPAGRATDDASRSREVVPGDVVLLAAGSLVPADGVVLESTDCFVNEAVLTGESFPGREDAGGRRSHVCPHRARELRLPRHERAERHRALSCRAQPAPRPSSARSPTG